MSLPLVAVGYYSGANDVASVHDANAAASTVSAIRLVAQVDAARTAVEDEVLPPWRPPSASTRRWRRRTGSAR